MRRRAVALITSPDPDARLARLVHPVARFRAEAVVETVGIDRRPVGAELVRRMAVDGQQLQRTLLARLGAPGLRPAEVEALVAGQAVDHRRRLAAERAVIGLEGDLQARQVGDVLA